MGNTIQQKEIKILKMFLYRNILQRFLQHSKSFCHTTERRLNLKDKESAHSDVLQSP